jgi:hypothetical protein
MNQLNLLRDKLRPLLGWHGARLNFLALFLIALIRVRTVNLVEVATGFRSDALTESSYKRLQRFFKDYKLDNELIARAIVELVGIPHPWVLSIDKTDWSFGQIQYFYVGNNTSGNSLSNSLDYVREEREFQLLRKNGFVG